MTKKTGNNFLSKNNRKNPFLEMKGYESKKNTGKKREESVQKTRKKEKK